MKKILTITIFSSLLFASSMIYGFWGLRAFSVQQPEILKILNPEITLGKDGLNSTVLVIKTGNNADYTEIKSDCTTKQSVLHMSHPDQNSSARVVELTFLGAACSHSSFIIQTQNPDISTSGSVRFTDTDVSFENLLNDTSATLLAMQNHADILIKDANQKIDTLKNTTSVTAKLRLIELAYQKRHEKLQSDMIAEILSERKNTKYISPVPGKTLPTKPVLIPNAPRPYRRDTTDGIHHGWDIMSPQGTPVQALGNGIIVRIVNNFTWNNFDKIIRGDHLSLQQQAKNLDILRGNQVWLKTMDGNITFYSHLKTISDTLFIGKQVNAGEILGAVGIS